MFVQNWTELRCDEYVPQLKVEGPKRIDQVHADAQWAAADRATAVAGGRIRQRNSYQSPEHDV